MMVLLHATTNLPIAFAIDGLAGRGASGGIAVVIWAGRKHLSRTHRKQKQRGGALERGVATPPVAAKPIPA